MTAAYPIDVEFIELARELVTDFVPTPNAVWIKNPNPAIPDAAKPWIQGVTTPTRFDVRIVFDRDDLEDRQLIKFKVIKDLLGQNQNTDIVDGQINGWMYPQGFEPTTNDECEFDGTLYKVKAIDPVKPVSKAIIYFIEFGK